MTASSETTRLSKAKLGRSLDVHEVKPGLKFTHEVLKDLLPDVETALFFAKVYELSAQQLAKLLLLLFKTPLTEALFTGEHSVDLQGYLIDIAETLPDVNAGDMQFAGVVPKGEILPELWKTLEVEVASSIKAVADRLGDVVSMLPGKHGSMLFKTMSVMNKKRPTIGDYKPHIHHERQRQNLVIFDVSGSMSEYTVQTVVDDVVALSYEANAHFAIVSNTCTYWEPGSYGSKDILAAAEFGGTRYEMLAPLFDRDWGTVITIADYDSSPAAFHALGACRGRIDEVLDISLVNRPTYMAQCVGQLAGSVRPLLVAISHDVLNQ